MIYVSNFVLTSCIFSIGSLLESFDDLFKNLRWDISPLKSGKVRLLKIEIKSKRERIKD